MRSVLITGCSSGFGLESTLALAGGGWRVFATIRDLTWRGPLEQAIERSGAQHATAAVVAPVEGNSSTKHQRSSPTVVPRYPTRAPLCDRSDSDAYTVVRIWVHTGPNRSLSVTLKGVPIWRVGW